MKEKSESDIRAVLQGSQFNFKSIFSLFLHFAVSFLTCSLAYFLTWTTWRRWSPCLVSSKSTSEVLSCGEWEQLLQTFKNEPFLTAERSERVENFLFHVTRKYTEAGIEQRCLGVNSPEPRRRAVSGWHASAQKTSSDITARPWLPGLIVGPYCPSEESLCCPACPPAHPVFADSRPPVSNVACLISLYLLSTCMYHTFSHITFLGYNHMNSRASVLLDSLLSEHIIRYHMCPWGRLIPGYHTRFFLQRGCCCQGKEVVPVDHNQG